MSATQPGPRPLWQMETSIRQFEADTNWRVSLPARVVLQQLFIALGSDQLATSLPVNESKPELGRRPLEPSEHRHCQHMMLQTLGKFLESLAEEANALLAQGGPVRRDDFTEIDAIFLVRHARKWPAIAKCLSIPV
ncbi:MAG TPA: hypothetical protein VMU81_16515 [Acetobacteraceae bacterium]|jgi:hypothetical protein|nr:hypothetical protein [Acetobacteraceae bacterium]